MAGDLSQGVGLDASIGQPRQCGVSQVVSAEVLERELCYYLVPVGGVAEDGCRDAAPAWAGEQACVGIAAADGDSPLDQITYLDDQRYVSRALALGGLVDEATR